METPFEKSSCLLAILAASILLSFLYFHSNWEPLPMVRKVQRCVEPVNVAFADTLYLKQFNPDAWIRRLDIKPCQPSFGDLLLTYNSTLGLCTTPEGKPIVWVFWDYTPMPAYIKLSLEMLECHNRDYAHIELVTDAKFRRFARDANFSLHPAFEMLIDAHKADYFRCLVLLAYGGFYADADTIHWNTLKPWFDRLAEGFDLFGYRFHNELLGIGYLGPMKRNLALMQHWLRDVHLLLDAKWPAFRLLEGGSYSSSWAFRPLKPNLTIDYPIGWAEMLRNILQPRMHQLFEKKRVKYFSIDGPSVIGHLQQIGFDRELFFGLRPNGTKQAQDLAALSVSEIPLFYYQNSQLDGRWKNVTKVDEFVATNVVFVRMWQISLERCERRLALNRREKGS